MPRPRSLTHHQIATAALAVLDRDGLDGLSMRAVAKELGVGTMSLYRYVSDRHQLESLIVGVVLSEVEIDLPPRATPRERLLILGERIRVAVGIHSATVQLLLTHRHTSAGSQRWGEAALGVLTEAGFTGRRRVVAFRAYLSYVLGALQTEHFSPLSGAGTAQLTELSTVDYPILVETAVDSHGLAEEEEFRRGLEFLLHGFGLD
jgi:AcrR family transcriptional regulator